MKMSASPGSPGKSGSSPKKPRAKNQTNRVPVPLESVEQKTMVRRLHQYGYQVIYCRNDSSELASLNARNHAIAMGLYPGCSDLIVLNPPAPYRVFGIEMKRANGKSSDVSDTQRQFLDMLRQIGGEGIVAFGATHGFNTLKRFGFVLESGTPESGYTEADALSALATHMGTRGDNRG